MKSNTNLQIATALLAIVLIAGCASGPRQPTLTYPAAAAAAAPKNKQIILNPFLDRRADKTNVGSMKSGLIGNGTNEVVPANDVAEWVTQAVKTELQNSGYTVTLGAHGGDTLPGASAIVSGEVLDVFNDPGRGGKVSLLATMRKGGKDVVNRKFTGDEAGRTVKPSEPVTQSLALALASAVKQFVAELDKNLAAP